MARILVHNGRILVHNGRLLCTENSGPGPGPGPGPEPSAGYTVTLNFDDDGSGMWPQWSFSVNGEAYFDPEVYVGTPLIIENVSTIDIIGLGLSSSKEYMANATGSFIGKRLYEGTITITQDSSVTLYQID